MQILTGLGAWPERMAFSPDGRYLAAGDDRAFHLWDLSAGPNRLWSTTEGYLARNFCFAPSGTALLGGAYGTFAWYDVETGKRASDSLLSNFEPEQFSPDGQFGLAVEDTRHNGRLRLACALVGFGKCSEVWEKEIAYNPDHIWNGYNSLLFSADSNRLVRTFARGRAVRNVAPTGAEVFDVASGDLVAEWTGELPSFLRHGAVGPTGTVVRLQYRALYAIDTTDPRSEPVKRLNASPKHFTSVAFSRDGTQLATASNDTAATIWDPTSWEVRRRYEWEIGRLRTVCFAPDGLRCAAGSDSGQVVVWDLDD